MIDAARHLLTLLLAAAGLFFMLVASVGLLRMPDLLTRMHAATKASTLGISGLALAALTYFANAEVSAIVLLTILFFFLTAPVGAHALGRAAYTCGVELCPQTWRFDLEEAHILCSTRGGPPSATLHERAIQLARDSRAELTFLYVISRDLVEGAAGPGEAMRMLSEMRSLGQSVVSAAQAQAQAHDVTARGEVRMGELQAEIVRLAQEIGATLVLLGYPEKSHAEEQHAAEEAVWRLTNAVQAKTGAHVVIVRETGEDMGTEV